MTKQPSQTELEAAIASATPAKKSARHVAALKYGKLGFRVHTCVPGRKEPAIKNNLELASCDAAQIDAMFFAEPEANIAWAPSKSGHFILDVDGAEGATSLQALEAVHGKLPPTLTFSTPRGGLHYVFDGVGPSTASKLGPHLDTRGIGGYGLLPPSVIGKGQYTNNPEGGSYTVKVKAKPAPLPEWIKEALAAASVKQVAGTNTLDAPQNIQRLRYDLERLVANGDVAIAESGGNDRTYRVCCAALDHGVSIEKAEELIFEIWNPACIPPWERNDPEGIEVMLGNALKYRQNEVGAYAVESSENLFGHIAAAASDEAEETSSDDGPVSFASLLNRTVPPLEELVPGLIEKGIVTFFSGAGGSNKSRLGLQWGLSLDAALPILGRQVERASFLCVSYEDTKDEVTRRAQKIAARLKLPTDTGGQYWNKLGKASPLARVLESGAIEELPFLAELRKYLLSVAGHKFVVLDSCYNALLFAGQAKINETSVEAAIGLLQRLCNDTDSTILVLWHPSQAGQERGDASGWSVAWHNGPRARISITAVKDQPDVFELRVEKRNNGPKGQPVTLYWSDGILLPRADTSLADQNNRFMDACVRVALLAAEHGAPVQKQRNPDGWVLDEIEKEVGRRPSKSDVKSALVTAMHEGRLRYLGATEDRTAGYYHPDMARAAEVAVAAKRQKKGAGNA